MNLHHRVLGSITGMGLILSLGLAACNGVDRSSAESSVATTDEAIIAGVDAKSASLNAVGALVEIYRYSYGGSTSVGGRPGTIVSTTTRPPPISIAIPIRNPLNGHLDLPSSLAAAAGAPSGGTPSRGGAPSTSTTVFGGQSSVGGTPSVAGSHSGGTGPTVVVQYRPFCSGTLIGPKAVLTAKHCLQDLDYMYSSNVDVGFAVGPDASNPTAVYPIVDWDWESEVAPDPYSLLSDLGSDVGVAHLQDPVVGVTPMALGTLTPGDIGKRFAAMGYGIQNNLGDSGTRKAGSVTLRGLGGNYADYAFGGLEGFLKAAKTMPDFEGLPDEYLMQIYDEMGLLPDYQAFLGGLRGDAQPCFGDSGGPLVALLNGQRTVFGNVTSGFASDRLRCDFGAVFAVFGPATQSFLQSALQWIDPCVGTTVQGHCEGDIAVRCTGHNEGKRRLSETDCGLLGQACGLDSTDTVACVDPPLVP